MDFMNCSGKRRLKNCCGYKTETNNEVDDYDHIYASLVECKSKSTNTENLVNTESTTTVPIRKRNKDSSIKHALWSTNSENFVCRPPSILAYEMDSTISEESRGVTHTSYNSGDNVDFQCPRCNQKMIEPKLLPCLHPICSPCIFELMNKPLYVSSKNEMQDNNRTYMTSKVPEICPLCDLSLLNINSVIPPPHYPLQHRLVMDTVRRTLVNRVLCDTCTIEVVAVVQCSTCLRNFCSECSIEHEKQTITEAKSTKHLMRPLWKATEVRRTVLCQIHPMHALRFYCIACQQVTCKECMWSIEHRYHASEDAIGAGKRAIVYLITMLQKAKVFLNNLLTRYNHAVFSNNNYEGPYNYRYIFF